MRKICINDSDNEMKNWLYNQTDGFAYSPWDRTKIFWKCPNCGNKVLYSPRDIQKLKYVPCKKCSDKISYPNKYMYNLLEQVGVQFETEYSPSWIKPKKYDFYIPNLKLIIEMDGALGHGHKNKMNGDDGSESIKVDMYKDEMASKMGLTIIRIDCFISDSDFIKDNILKSRMSEFFSLNNVDFLLCHKNAISSYKIKVCEKWNECHDMETLLKNFKFARATMIKWLTQCAKYNMCDYDAKLQQHLSGKRNIAKAYNANKKPVICLETNKVYESCREAYKWLGYNIDGHSIQDNCNKITYSAGKHPETKEKLHWMFYEDYLLSGGVLV